MLLVFLRLKLSCRKEAWRPKGTKEAEAFVNAFPKRSMPSLGPEVIQTRLNCKAVIMEYSHKKKKRKKKQVAKGLSAKQRRDMRLFEIKPEQQRKPHMIQPKLLKADLHGALVSVTKSKCPSYVGLKGIILQEMKHIFKIITKEDRLKASQSKGGAKGEGTQGKLASIVRPNE